MQNSKFGKKPFYSRISTAFYLQWNSNKKYERCTKRNVSFFCIFCLIIILYLLDASYWIGHGYAFHRKHFQWTSSLNGSYCKEPRISTLKGKGIHLNNVNFEQTRSRILLMSYPRSGNHLTKSVIECLLETKTFGYEQEKNDAKEQLFAIHNASIQHPYIRKFHFPGHIRRHFFNFSEWGLIFLVRDPVESILSENKYVPKYWKDYEYVFGNQFVQLPKFYNDWASEDSKIIIFYEDYFNGLYAENLQKIAKYFGSKRVSKERLDYCVEHFNEITQIGLNSLDRGASSTMNLHFYRDKYYGKDAKQYPMMKVPSYMCQNMLCRYENIESC